jgi:hypothetical protein
MDWLALLLLPVAFAAVVYAIVRHGQDAQLAGGIAAVAVVVSLIMLSGAQSSGVNILDIFINPVKVLDAYIEVIGGIPTLLLILGGAGMGFLVAMWADRPERRPESPNLAATQRPPDPPVTNPTTAPPEPASPRAHLWSLSPQ